MRLIIKGTPHQARGAAANRGVRLLKCQDGPNKFGETFAVANPDDQRAIVDWYTEDAQKPWKDNCHAPGTLLYYNF